MWHPREPIIKVARLVFPGLISSSSQAKGMLGYPSPPWSAALCRPAFPTWSVVELGAVQEAGMRCHFWVNGRNSPPLAYSSAYTSCSGSAVQENSPPWPTSNPTLRDIRPTMALPSCIGRRRRTEFMGGEQLVACQILLLTLVKLVSLKT